MLEQAAMSRAKMEDGGVLAPCWSRQPCPVLRRKMAVCCCHSRLWIGLFSPPGTGWNVCLMMFWCPSEGDGMLWLLQSALYLCLSLVGVSELQSVGAPDKAVTGGCVTELQSAGPLTRLSLVGVSELQSARPLTRLSLMSQNHIVSAGRTGLW